MPGAWAMESTELRHPAEMEMKRAWVALKNTMVAERSKPLSGIVKPLSGIVSPMFNRGSGMVRPVVFVPEVYKH